jgi:hypothetical protein
MAYRTAEDIRMMLNARIDTEATRIAQLTQSVDDLERKSALFLNYTTQPSLDVDATNSRIAEALSSADTANVTANSAYGLANTTNQTVEHMRTRFDTINTALAHTTHDFNYVWSHIALLLDKSFPVWRGDVEDWILAISMVWSTLSCPTHMICLVTHLP